MTTMLETVVPKSDQLNADDLMAGQTKTIKITSVSIAMGEQPVSMHYEGDNGKPYKPGKSMRRVLIHCWGADANKYIGRTLTIYRDEKVKFGGVDVGGLRISHMSDIQDQVTIALTATRALRKPFTVRPLVAVEHKIDDALEHLKTNARDAALNGIESLETWWESLPKESKAKVKPFMEEYKSTAKEIENTLEEAP